MLTHVLVKFGFPGSALLLLAFAPGCSQFSPRSGYEAHVTVENTSASTLQFEHSIHQSADADGCDSSDDADTFSIEPGATKKSRVALLCHSEPQL